MSNFLNFISLITNNVEYYWRKFIRHFYFLRILSLYLLSIFEGVGIFFNSLHTLDLIICLMYCYYVDYLFIWLTISFGIQKQFYQTFLVYLSINQPSIYLCKPMFLWVCVHIHIPQYACGGPWSVLVASTFTWWAILTALWSFLISCGSICLLSG